MFDLYGALLLSGKVTLPPVLALVLLEVVGVQKPLVMQTLQPSKELCHFMFNMYAVAGALRDMLLTSINFTNYVEKFHQLVKNGKSSFNFWKIATPR